jgi:hypothetical protein
LKSGIENRASVIEETRSAFPNDRFAMTDDRFHDFWGHSAAVAAL